MSPCSTAAAPVHPDAVDGFRVPPRLTLSSDSDEREGDGGGMPASAPPVGHSPFQPHAGRPVSISLPSSPTGFDSVSRAELPPWMMMLPPCAPAALAQADKVMFLSQPIAAAAPPEANSTPGGRHYDFGLSVSTTFPANKARRDSRYDSFKTWSGKLEKQIGEVKNPGPGSAAAEEDDDHAPRNYNYSTPRVQRFFAALEGPELDRLRSSEELVLPSDKTWPFLLRFPVSAFGMCLGMGSQTILWKTIAVSASTRFLHVTARVNLALWCASVALMAAVSALYAAKAALYFEAVRREYYHPIRVNFFFAPWIACLFLAIGVPEAVAPAASSLPPWLWYVLMAPVACLELKIYGQWVSGGQRRLSRVANPSNHLAIVGNFVGALLGGAMGLREGPMFFFSVGLAHYVVLFVTLYQRLPTSETLPRDLHPVFFLFVAAPSVACLALARIAGEFGQGSRVAYFVAMFLYASLAVRVNLFRGFSFSLAWWAYTFPMSSAATASIRYASEVSNAFTRCMCAGLAAAATLTVAALFVTTLLHALVHRDLFPNDISIAITDRRRRRSKHHEPEDMHLRRGPPPLSAVPSDVADLEAARAAAATSYT